jgi:tRNA-2-methylthio-N6-dimethylallyladenosine synthase
MRRGYDRENYLEKIQAIRRRIPEILFGTDIIVGFPGESDREFDETMSLLDEVPYDTVYSFAYSERPGTASLALGDTVPLSTKMERLRRLQHRQQEIQRRRGEGWVGRTVPVLVEGRSKRDASRWTGRTPENRIVHFPGTARPGQVVRVEVTSATAFSLRGTRLS